MGANALLRLVHLYGEESRSRKPMGKGEKETWAFACRDEKDCWTGNEKKQKTTESRLKGGC